MSDICWNSDTILATFGYLAYLLGVYILYINKPGQPSEEHRMPLPLPVISMALIPVSLFLSAVQTTYIGLTGYFLSLKKGRTHIYIQGYFDLVLFL
ncbi:hypothetical protein DFS33DRAFT_1278843 [Desarmillaria ectypa]|nr:hypothetical protein DFS33DRAFT_1278843 [Desarmillaria ectypa]